MDLSSKDWILMFVPIVVNGVLIFAFQSLVQVKFNKSIRINERKSTVVDDLLTRLMNLSDSIYRVEGCFRLRDELTDAIEAFGSSISDLSRYGSAVGSVLKMSDDLEKLRAKCMYCHSRLVRYNAAGDQNEFLAPIEEQAKIVDELEEVRGFVREIISKVIRT